eukprot:8410994-Lingulodinium_polyedra.AAC.1
MLGPGLAGAAKGAKLEKTGPPHRPGASSPPRALCGALLRRAPWVRGTQACIAGTTPRRPRACRARARL